MATKRGKRGRGKTTAKGSAKARSARTPARGAERGRGERRTARAPERRGVERRTTPDRRAGAAGLGGGLLQRAEALSDAIRRSKLTAPDPWRYTTKARAWGQRADELVTRLRASGETATLRQAVQALSAELDADRDFQAARRLF